MRGNRSKINPAWPFRDQPIVDQIQGDVYTNIKGRMFGRWIDYTNNVSRSNGYNENGFIENPDYCIESIFRDEIFTERDLTIESFSSSTVSAGVNPAVYLGLGVLDDCTSGGAETSGQSHTYEVKIASIGTPNQFQWRAEYYGFKEWSSSIAITGSAQALDNGITVTFGATTGHSLADYWTITSIPGSSGNTIVVCSQLKYATDGYYVGAILNNLSTGNSSYIIQYDGSTHSLYLDGSDGNTNDDFYLSNIKGDERIDIDSFDAVGNSTNGTRNGWKFRFSLNQKKSSHDIIDQMLFESHCMGFDTYGGFKIIALDPTTDSVDTWTMPLNRVGVRSQIKGVLTSPANLYTDFRLHYGYDYGSGQYKKQLFVNSKGYTTTVDLSAEQTLCQGVITNHHIPKRLWEYNADFIYDDDTALAFLQKQVAWKTKQQLNLEWTGDFSTYAKYERGDQVKVEFPRMVPNGMNNNALFIIYSKVIDTQKHHPSITFKLRSFDFDTSLLEDQTGDTITSDDDITLEQ